ncbi:MAG TPA: polysaccharide deacetylase family protein [Chloroflexia bacterium]|nr:polysaccharide deacetylase family protein [Chloroflexia bacterium]
MKQADSESSILAVLGFHKVGAPPPGGWDTWFYVPETTFVGYLTYLREHGWEAIGVESLLRGLPEPGSLPSRSVLITFDDGYRSLLEVAVPHLLRFGYPATLFVPTDFIGGSNLFDEGVEPEEAICDWADLRELTRLGISVQSHGAAHRPFSTLNPAEQRAELEKSKAALEHGLGEAVELFSYPYGDAGPDADATRRALAEAGYKAACLYGGGPNRLPTSNPYRLARLAMGPDTDLHALLSGFGGKDGG